MNKRIKKLWIQALRSGEFKQGRGYLERGNRYCALGVLSVLALVEGQCTYAPENNLGKYDNKKYSLSFNTMAWAGIAQENDYFLEPGAGLVKFHLQGRLTSIQKLNDDGLSFAEISKIIDIYL